MDRNAVIEPGTEVRLVRDLGRSGYTTGKTKSRGSIVLQQVGFPEGRQYVPVDQLEIVPEEIEDPLELLHDGKLGLSRDLRRAMTHVRLTGRLADVIYSMDITGTDYYPHQFKPVLKIMNAPGRGILVADEVGLGKTIEAGLIWTELRARFDYGRLFVLCPAFLREKWRDELLNRFGIDAEIVKAGEAARRLERAALDRDEGFALIGSLQGLRPPSEWRADSNLAAPSARLADVLFEVEHEAPLIDLLVIDEAHYLRNPETQTAQLGRLARGAAQHIALLTATPIHLRNSDLYQLLNLIDEDTFQHSAIFHEILQANRPLVEARDLVLSKQATPEALLRLLREARSHSLLSENRQLQSLLEDPPTEEALENEESVSRLAQRLETVNLTAHSINRTRKRDVQEWRVVREARPEPIPLNEVERQFYEKVTEIVRRACEKASYAEGLLLVTPQRQVSSSMPAALRYWLEKGKEMDEKTTDSLMYEDLGVDDRRDRPGPILGTLIDAARHMGNLDELYANDSKYQRLREQLTAFFEKNPGEKVVLFSYFRGTLGYLRERLTQDGVENMLLIGGDKSKNQVIDAFRKADRSTVLLSSEVGSEGIDLQFCRVLVNYDLPWNPMRIEQRIGRLDRLGQEAEKITIWNLFYEGTIDSRIYRRLYQRLKIFKHSLGDLEPILGERIQRLTSELFHERLTPEQEEERIQQTAQAIENNRRQEEELEDKAAHLVAYGDYILRQVHAAKDLNRSIQSVDLRTYVLDFFRQRYPGSRFKGTSDEDLDYEISLSNTAKNDLEEYVKEHRLHGQTSLVRASPAPVQVRFENTVVQPRRSRRERISQFHPLVRFASDRIGEAGTLQFPAVAIRLKASESWVLIPDVYVFTVQRWSFVGLRDEEKLWFAASRLAEPERLLAATEAERLVMAATNEGVDWTEAVGKLDLGRVHDVANEILIADSDERFEQYRQDLEVQNADRASIQERSLEDHRDRQLEKLEQVRIGHERKGRDSLVKATEGRINKLRSRIDRQLLKLESRRTMSSRKEEICVGVVELEPFQ